METATLDQVKQEQAIFTDLWNIYKQYKNITTDEDWKKYVAETDQLFKTKYKGTEKEEMFRDLFLDITKQLERNQKEAVRK
jgi:hypothetical protein